MKLAFVSLLLALSACAESAPSETAATSTPEVTGTLVPTVSSACADLAIAYAHALDGDARLCDPSAADACSAWRYNVGLRTCTVDAAGTTTCTGTRVPAQGPFVGDPVLDPCLSPQQRAWVNAGRTAAVDAIAEQYVAAGCMESIGPGCMPDCNVYEGTNCVVPWQLPAPSCESRDGGPALCYGASIR